jgi:hypothetical protein
VKHILAVLALVAFLPQAHAQTRIADAAFVKAMTPPAEFDHRHKGIVIITRTKDQAETRKLCAVPFPMPLAIGCAKTVLAGTILVGCEIVISPDSVIALSGLTLEFVKRHEIAHCNGWPADHRGAREPARQPLVDSADLPLAGIPHEVGIILAGARTKAGRAEFEGHQEWASN